MNTGLPGTGLATIFYVLSVLVMPIYELVRKVRGLDTSVRRWRLMLRHLLVSAVMLFMFIGTWTFVPAVRIGSLLVASPYVAFGVVAALLVVFFVVLPRFRPSGVGARA